MVMQLSKVSVERRLLPFSAQVMAGAQIHLIGPNGAGKSTLLARIAGLLAGAGEVILAGKALSAYQGDELAARRAYFCQQQSATLMIKVFQYLELHQPVADSEAVAATVSYLCQQLRLTNKLSHPLTQLSGGEWQRVRLAAAFLQVWPALNPYGALLLLDEPANNLDISQNRALERLLREFCQAGGAVITSSQDINYSFEHADEVWLLAGGKVVAQGGVCQVMEQGILSHVFEVDFHLQNQSTQRWVIN